MLGNKARVIVKSVEEGEASTLRQQDEKYFFAEGEVGILDWVPHVKDTGFWSPVVVWDNDPKKRRTSVRLEQIKLLGIEALSRFVLQ